MTSATWDMVMSDADLTETESKYVTRSGINSP